MPYLIAALLILLPSLAWLAWRQFGPDPRRPSPLLLAALATGLLLVAGLGLSVRLSQGDDTTSVYVPPSLGPDGRVQPSRMVPTR
ncbi:hypothetical protein ACLF3G_15005 [Falsiroseomonas sp. HC035]|uniref:hypothetical protein n=1 Tax=Falsiroseomonas sp. HC035 TaxID=3390999 RepID=UPI003D319967